MPTLKQVLCASLVSSLFFTTGTAEARFGKRSKSSSSSGSETHEASPVGSSSGKSSKGGKASRRGRSSRGTSNPVGTILDVLFLAADVAAVAERVSSHDTSRVSVALEPGPTPVYPSRREPVVTRSPEPEERHHNPLMFRLGVEGQSLRGGASVGLNVGLEGRRWGVGAAATSLRLPTDDGTAGGDRLDMLSAHLTFALYTSDHARLRMEGGMAAAKAPDVLMVGPSFALSFERCLFGVLDLESRGQVVPVPYLQVDAQAGLALRLGVLTLRTGWRVQVLDDRGLVDGVVHRDFLSGPYAGIGLSL